MGRGACPRSSHKKHKNSQKKKGDPFRHTHFIFSCLFVFLVANDSDRKMVGRKMGTQASVPSLGRQLAENLRLAAPTKNARFQPGVVTVLTVRTSGC